MYMIHDIGDGKYDWKCIDLIELTPWIDKDIDESRVEVNLI